ncbi:hypothetical protein IHE33_14490 (plasmid) [Mycetohabitans endofungorum]
MKKSRFTDSQIMDALKRVEAGLAVPGLCRKLSISTATFLQKIKAEIVAQALAQKSEAILPT